MLTLQSLMYIKGITKPAGPFGTMPQELGRFPVQNPLGARPGLGTQPRYEAPGDLQVEYVQKRSD